MAESLPMYSLSFVLATPTELWSLRYPDTDRLMMLKRVTARHTEPAHRIRLDDLDPRAAKSQQEFG